MRTSLILEEVAQHPINQNLSSQMEVKMLKNRIYWGLHSQRLQRNQDPCLKKWPTPGTKQNPKLQLKVLNLLNKIKTPVTSSILVEENPLNKMTKKWVQSYRKHNKKTKYLISSNSEMQIYYAIKYYSKLI